MSAASHRNMPSGPPHGATRRAFWTSVHHAGRLAGHCLLVSPWSYGSIAIAALLLITVVPRTIGFFGVSSLFARWALLVGMAAGIADAARCEERRVHGIFGFVLNVLALVAWAVSSVILRATQPD